MPSNEIVALTCYFNPVGYRRRRSNYHLFRDRLDAPLMTVELTYGEERELTERDADWLIQIDADDILWQKERLLNLALQALPDETRSVVWLDCDLIFDRADWLSRTADALQTVPLLQPYSIVHDLDSDADPTELEAAAVVYERPSMAALHVAGAIDSNDTRTNCMRQHSPGHAWAARRDVLACGFYDAMILGSGDLAMAMAALGNWESVVDAFQMNPRQAQHYRHWAKRWHQAIRRRIGVIEGDLFHLWHGSLDDRGYESRYASIVPYGFDPEHDLVVAENGSWRWNSAKPGFHETVAAYFASRQEDGPV